MSKRTDLRRRLGHDAVELLEQRLCLSTSYELKVIASTDGSTEGFRTLGRGPSINDSGLVAFVGSKLNNGDGSGNNRQLADNLYSYDGLSNKTLELMNRAFMYPNAGAHQGQALSQVFGDLGEVQINNQGEVLARRRLNARVSVGLLGGVQTQPLSYFELWSGRSANALPISQPAMGDGGAGAAAPLLLPINPVTAFIWPSSLDYFSDYAGMLRYGSVNNHSDVAYVGIASTARGGGYQLTRSSFDGSVRVFLNVNPQNPQVMMSDLGTIVFRDDAGAIRAVAASPTSPPSHLVASNASGFTQLGIPGITDDGSLIVFSGRHSTMGEGVYVSAINMATNTYAAPVRVLGISGDGVLDPGETHNDANSNGVVDAGEDAGGVRSFDLTSRVNANRFRSDYAIAFLGRNSADQAALFTLTVDITPTVTVSGAPVLVAAAGQSLEGVSGTISQIGIYDSVNNHGSVNNHDSVNNHASLVFWARTNAGVETIVTAEPPPPAAVVVLTHGFGNVWNTPIGGRLEIFSGFLETWGDLGQTFRELPQDGSELDNAVETYVANWNSSDGWIDAAIPLFSSFVLTSTGHLALAALALSYVSDHMGKAALNAERAASRIADEVILGAGLTLEATANGSQVIQLVGHSRGAAVNASVAEILAKKGFFIEEYISLDGYSTDWPNLGSLLSDIDISATIALAGAKVNNTVNYRVQDGLATILAQGLFSAISTVGNSLGLGTIFTPTAIAAINLSTRDWKAPERKPKGFDKDEIIVAAGNVPSNHLNITPIYLNTGTSRPLEPNDPVGIKPYIWDSYVGQHGGYAAPAATYATAAVRSPQSDTNPAIDAIPTPLGFADRDFETSRQKLAIGQDPQVTAHAEPLVRLWGKLVGDPRYALGAFWDVTGDVQLVVDADDAMAELTESDATSLGQLIDLRAGDASVRFSLDVVAPGENDRLSVQLDGVEFASVPLAVGSSVQTFALPANLPKFGTITLALDSNPGQVAKVRVDDLAIVAEGVLVGDLNSDGLVDGADASILIGNWGTSTIADINSDGIIDAADMGILFENWGRSGSGDINADGIVDSADAAIIFASWGRSTVGDINSDRIVDGADFGLIYSNWTGDSTPTTPVAKTTPVAASSLPSKSISRPLRANLVDAVMTDKATPEELLSPLAAKDFGTPLTRDRNATKSRTVRRNVR